MTRLGSLMNTAYYVAKSGLSFLKYTEICELQIKNGLDLGENYLTDVACTRLISSIADDTKSDLKFDVANARFLAVLSDGSTDAGILEEEAVYLRYVKNGIPLIFKAIEDVLISLKEANNLEDDATFLDAVYNKLVNCNFDGANVMSGSKTGVQTRLREKQPGIVYTHCVAHRLELATLDSLKFDSYLEKFDETINNIFKFYFYSPTRRKELRDLSVIFNEEFKQLGLMKNI